MAECLFLTDQAKADLESLGWTFVGPYESEDACVSQNQETGTGTSTGTGHVYVDLTCPGEQLTGDQEVTFAIGVSAPHVTTLEVDLVSTGCFSITFATTTGISWSVGANGGTIQSFQGSVSAVANALASITVVTTTPSATVDFTVADIENSSYAFDECNVVITATDTGTGTGTGTSTGSPSSGCGSPTELPAPPFSYEDNNIDAQKWYHVELDPGTTYALSLIAIAGHDTVRLELYTGCDGHGRGTGFFGAVDTEFSGPNEFSCGEITGISDLWMLAVTVGATYRIDMDPGTCGSQTGTGTGTLTGCEEATSLTLGAIQAGSITGTSERDWYVMTGLDPDTQYSINLWTQGTPAGVLTGALYTTCERTGEGSGVGGVPQILTADSSDYGQCSNIVVGVTTLYIEVQYNNAGSADYELAVYEGLCTDTGTGTGTGSDGGGAESPQGPLFPGTGASDASVGVTAWTNPGNISADDGVYATCTSNSPQYLKATNFGFSIPDGATIDGIEVKIQLFRTGPRVHTVSNVRMVKADGSISTTNRASDNTVINTTETENTYGGDSILWGETWTAADINDADFGVVFNSAPGGGKGIPTISVDCITVKVWFH